MTSSSFLCDEALQLRRIDSAKDFGQPTNKCNERILSRQAATVVELVSSRWSMWQRRPELTRIQDAFSGIVAYRTTAAVDQ